MSHFKKIILILLSISLISIFSLPANSAIPNQINYQGRLTDNTGSPVPNGPYDITFSVYNDINELQWNEVQSDVLIINGIFNVLLPGNPGVGPFPDGLFNEFLYIGIQVGTDDEMIPLQPLTSVPFAFKAEDADTLDGHDSTDFLSVLGGTLTGSLHVESDDGALFGGTYTFGSIPATGVGTRMMWYPGKAAFRSGYVDSTEWDDVNIGDYSTAMGSRTIASGPSSTALGDKTTASGNYSTVMGRYSIASGHFSFATGYEANSSGQTSTAMGNRANAAGDSSTALGLYPTANGDYSTAIGGFTTASGNYATALGASTTASETASTAMGYGTTASGKYSTAIGYLTTAESYQETVIGSYNTADASPDPTNWVLTDRLFTIANGTFSTPSNAMTVLKNGKVGIGTSTPAELLTVAGTIESTSGGVKFPDGTAQLTAAFGDITAVNAGTGLTGGGTSGDVTMDLEIPLDLSGSSTTEILSAFNYNSSTGYGIFASASGDSGRGIFATASGTEGRGVYGWATGITGIGVYGKASNTATYSNYGGFFEASGEAGRGVWGWASGIYGRGVSGSASNTGEFTTNYGGHFEASGASGRGVYGYAPNTGDVGNYGGYFEAKGTYGTGVYGKTTGNSGYGVYGDAIGSGTAGYFASTSGYGLIVENGNVGIGTTAPQSALHINGGQWDLDTTEGDFKIGNSTYRLKIGVALGGAGAGNVSIRAQGGANGLHLGAGDNGYVLTVRNGMVGIGETLPTSKLEVDGTVTATSFVATDGVPTVTSAGQVWMDRNLGALRISGSSSDSLAYGWLYQWGRLADGHESRTSPTSPSQSVGNVPGHGSFITGNGDWRSTQEDNLWQGESGTNNPCPSGFRLPTETELETERLSWSSYDAAGAFASPLKLVMAGYRNHSDGSLYSVGSYGLYWSSTVNGSSSRDLYFVDSHASMDSSSRAFGFSVRCLKD